MKTTEAHAVIKAIVEAMNGNLDAATLQLNDVITSHSFKVYQDGPSRSVRCTPAPELTEQVTVRLDSIEVMTRAIKAGLIEDDENTAHSVALVTFGREMFQLGVSRVAKTWFEDGLYQIEEIEAREDLP